MKGLQNRISELLAAKKQNASWLAYRLNVSRAYVSRVVRGKLRPGVAAAMRIARCLGKPVEEVFQLAEEESNVIPSFQPISRRASVRAGDENNTAEINKHKQK